MVKRSPVVLFVTVVVLLAAGNRRAEADAVEGYCCLCGACPAAACLLVDVPPMTTGIANVGKACPDLCPTGCNRSILLDGACALHTAAECPKTDPAPVLSLSVLVLCIAVLGSYGVRRLRRA